MDVILPEWMIFAILWVSRWIHPAWVCRVWCKRCGRGRSPWPTPSEPICLAVPGLFSFPFPRLCHHLLSQDLAIASVPTWWCRQNNALKYVMENLRKLVLKPAFPRLGTHPHFRGNAFGSGTVRSRSKKFRPSRWNSSPRKICRRLPRPVLLSDQLQSRRCVIRAFSLRFG